MVCRDEIGWVVGTKGSPPSRTLWRKKRFIAAESVIPSSANSSSASCLRSSLILIVIFELAMVSLFQINNVQCMLIVMQTMRNSVALNQFKVYYCNQMNVRCT